MKAIWFGSHLYQPLLYLDSKIVEISPAPLNKGERLFVEDLKAFHDGDMRTSSTDKELYLLRNLSKGKGVGFFEAGNFHPDFILWLLADGKQHVIFVDPKGIRNLGPTRPEDPVPRDHQGDRAAAGRCRRPAGLVHRLEHPVGHDADAVEHGEGGDAAAAHRVPGGGWRYLCAGDAGERRCVIRYAVGAASVGGRLTMR